MYIKTSSPTRVESIITLQAHHLEVTQLKSSDGEWKTIRHTGWCQILGMKIGETKASSRLNEGQMNVE